VELLEEFDLVDAADRPAKTFSGGMQRRLDLAASLVGQPWVLFLDEPTTGLDPRSRLGMWDIIRSLVAGGTTILLTTQYLDEADELADEIVVIDHGQVIEAVRRLDGAGVQTQGLALRRPSLDDVFLALTGHAAEEEGQPGQGRRGRSRSAKKDTARAAS